jgi:hypothetical protein
MGIQLSDCICDSSGKQRSFSKALADVEGGGKRRKLSEYRYGGGESYMGCVAECVACA